MPPKAVDVLVKRLLEEARQTNSSRGSPAGPLNLNDRIKDVGGLNYVG